ncbi:peptidoglycan-binding protein [Pseudomonadota bacterium]
MKTRKNKKTRLFATALLITSLSALAMVPIAKAQTTEVPQTLSAGEVIVAKTPEVKSVSFDTSSVRSYPYSTYFVISAYYSPLPGQERYATGSYSADIRLNGSGVNGADGTPVYPGMIAAPKTYPFGTKMKIEGVGTVAVHDRGGAIVTAGNRGYSYDRLDIWMGYGDAGLKRALNWGKRTVPVTVYGIDPSIAEYVTLPGYNESEKHVVANTLTNSEQSGTSSAPAPAPAPSEPAISSGLSIGSTGTNVEYLQSKLSNLGYYEGPIDGVYDNETANAVYRFQLDQKIVYSEYDYGAGFFGPKTSRILASTSVNVAVANAQTENFDINNVFNSDLTLGASGDEVRKLQAELKNINLLGIDPTGYYGEVTSHAVFKFQQVNELAGSKESPGAGIFGPKTRGAFNELLAERERLVSSREES